MKIYQKKKFLFSTPEIIQIHMPCESAFDLSIIFFLLCCSIICGVGNFAYVGIIKFKL